MNASTHSATGVTPASILFGNAIQLDKGIFLPQTVKLESDTSKDVVEWMENMQKKQAEIIHYAQTAQKQTDDYHMTTSIKDCTEFPIGSYVLVQYRDKPPTKFHTRWAGPMKVIKFQKSNYTLLNLVDGKQKDYHITQLKAFDYDAMETNPVDIALSEAQEYEVEKILNHRGDKKKRSDLEFLVKWVGYDEENNSWEPWANLRDTSQLHDYLKINKMRSLMSKEQQQEQIRREAQI
jgi:hypothetical protein